MKNRILTGATALILLCGSGLSAQENEAAVQKEIAVAREVIKQYVDTRQEIAISKNEWKAYKELTERRINLYKSEIEQLRTTIDKAKSETTQAEREIEAIRSDIAQLRSATSIVGTSLPAFETKLRELAQYFPAPLKNKIKALLPQLGKSRQTSDRMAIVIAILNEVDKFNSEFNIASVEKQLAGGENILVDVVYLGLATAYYSNRDGTVGGIGSPAAGEWEWEERNDIAPLIHEAIQYYQGDIKPANLVNLPVRVKTIETGY